MQIVGLHGLKRSGKDTAASPLIESHGYARYAFGDQLKECMYVLDPFLDGPLTVTELIEQDGLEPALNHRIHGPEMRRLVPTLDEDVFTATFGSHDADLIDELTTLNPRLGGTITLGMLLDSLDGDWEQAKDHRIHGAEVRRLVQVFGTEVVRATFGANAWVDYLAGQIRDDNPELVVVTDVRFDSEAEWVRRMGGPVIHVIRPGVVSDGHGSEAGIDPRLIDHVVLNNSTIAELHHNIETILGHGADNLAAAA